MKRPRETRELVMHRTPALAILTDLGRAGYAEIAVPTSGAYDRKAYARANRLVGNPVGAAAIEFVLGPLSFESPGATTFAVTGIDADITVSAGGRVRSFTTGETVSAQPGSVVHVRVAQSGLRGYLAVRGGLEGTPVLGSLSYDSLSALGPAPLAAGDRVPIGTLGGPFPSYGGRLAEATATPDGSATHLRIAVLPGPRDGLLVAGWEQITSSTWTVSMASDRVGMRLTGPAIELSTHHLAASEPMVRGGIEVPPDGQPVILGPDHPTTGGYPVIGVVNPRDSDALAQARPGSTVDIALDRTG